MRHDPVLKKMVAWEACHGEVDRNRFPVTADEQSHEKATNDIGGEVRKKCSTRRFRRPGAAGTHAPYWIPSYRFGLVAGLAKYMLNKIAGKLAKVAKEGQ
mmetsp:Transcript_174/g.408  ORF Transcript_174/g.408 Transcript_174/m.408 type:complete len:100 (-) Transcript_174:909-1208(-)